MYLWIKAFHIMAVISWMAALFYYPRLIIYQVEADEKDLPGDIFNTMRHKLIKIIMTPAMIASWIAGLLLISLSWEAYISEIWFWIKITALLIMSWYHGMCIKWHKQILAGLNMRSGKYYRLMNEVPTLLMILIVIMVVVKPI